MNQAETDRMSYFCGTEIISAYSRAQAIEDGLLIDVTKTAQEAGIKCSVAMTRAAWADLVAWDRANRAVQDEEGRLWDVLFMTWMAIRRAGAGKDRLKVVLFRVPNTSRAWFPS